jgi:hypothetical protein
LVCAAQPVDEPAERGFLFRFALHLHPSLEIGELFLMELAQPFRAVWVVGHRLNQSVRINKRNPSVHM